MTEISASEKKRIIAAIKRWKPSDNLAFRPLVQRPPQPAHHRRFEQRFTQLMKKAGVDVHKLNESLRRRRSEQHSPIKKRPHIDKKAIAAATRVLRYGIKERRRSAKQLAALDAQPALVSLDTPFFIDPVSDPSVISFETNIQPLNSTAKFSLFRDQDGESDALLFNFHFLWRNDSFQDALVSAASVLVAKGQMACSASALFGSAFAATTCTAELNILELWNDPPTSPLVEQTQQFVMGASSADALAFLDPDTDEPPPLDVFRGFQLYHNNYFTVPARQAAVFEVGIDIFTTIGINLDADAGIGIDFISDGGFLTCPFVELQVLPVQRGLVPSAFARRATGKKLRGRRRALPD